MDFDIFIAGFFVLFIYALFVLCVRKCFVSFVQEFLDLTGLQTLAIIARAHLQEPVELAPIPVEGLDLNQPVNFYEVVMPARPAAQQATINLFVP